MRNFDVVIVGAGSGGYASAIRAAQKQKKVAIVERGLLGGTCLNRGCIPTKALLHVANLFYQQRDFSLLGITGKLGIDALVMNQRKEDVITTLRTGIENLLKANQVEIIIGEARIQSANVVVVNGEQLSTSHVLLATGSKVASVPIKGIEHAYSSDDILEFGDKLFEDVVIIGGGVIGIEFATLYQQLGKKVTILEAKNALLAEFDKELSQNLAMILKKRDVNAVCKASVSSIEKLDTGCLVTYRYNDKEYQIIASAVIVAVGRMGNGVDSDIPLQYDKDRIKVNACYQTSVPNVYAIGDCSSRIQLAHIATHQGIAAIDHMFEQKCPVDHAIPMCVYTNPEIACVGYTQQDAEQAGIEVLVGKFNMLGNGKTIIEHQDRGFVKLVVDRNLRILVGAQLMCDRASDMIPILCHAIVHKTTIEELQQVVYPHPSFAEGIQEALLDVTKQAIHVIPKK